MNLISPLLDRQNSEGLAGWALVIIVLCLVLWLWSVVVVAKEKTEDPYDRIVWLLIVLMLNFLGTLLYFFFGGDAKSREAEKAKSEQDIKRRANNGTL
ncbi:MAG: PLD nuclease N-terminal domain-containing protein [Opitutaceae bacterium]|jgi:hypothetical protein